MRAVDVHDGSEQSLVLAVQNPRHQTHEWRARIPGGVRHWCHAATGEPPRETSFREAQTAKAVGSGKDLHLRWSHLDDARCAITADMASVRSAVATMTDDARESRPRKIRAPHDGTAATA
jgi:hypothetical protein